MAHERMHSAEKPSIEAPTEISRHSKEVKAHYETERPQERQERLENARKEALEYAQGIKSPEYTATAEAEKQLPNNEQTPTGKKQQEASFKRTMREAQKHMSGAQRTFSKVIHTPAIEKSSDIIGATIARPDALLSGAVFAFLAVLSLYITARYVGFALSGFETIGAFLIGWLVGVIFDILRNTFRKG